MRELSPGARDLIEQSGGRFPMNECLLLLAAVIDSESVADAGANIGLSDDRATRLLRGFQSKFDTQEVFDKHGNKKTAGTRLVQLRPEFSRYLDAYDSLAAVLIDTLSGRSRTVRLGTYNPALKLFLAKAVGAFSQESREHRLLLPRDMTDRRGVDGRTLVDDLEDDRLDVVVAPITDGELEQLRQTDLVVEVLYRWDIVAIASSANEVASAGHESVTPTDLADQPLLLAPKAFSSRRQIDAAFRAEHVLPRCIHENPDTETRVRLALNGYGVTLAPNDTIAEPSASGRPWPLFLTNEEKVSGAYALITKPTSAEVPSRVHPDALDSLLNHIRDAASRFRAERELRGPDGSG